MADDPPVGRFFLAVDVTAQLSPRFEATATDFPGSWGVIAADDTVDPADGVTYPAYACLRQGEILPSTFTAGTKASGTVVLETAAEEGWVTLRPLSGEGWEWRYNVAG